MERWASRETRALGLGDADMVAVVRAIEQRTATIVWWPSYCQGGSVSKPVTVTVFSDYV